MSDQQTLAEWKTEAATLPPEERAAQEKLIKQIAREQADNEVIAEWENELAGMSPDKRAGHITALNLLASEVGRPDTPEERERARRAKEIGRIVDAGQLEVTQTGVIGLRDSTNPGAHDTPAYGDKTTRY